MSGQSVVLADRHRLFRSALRATLEANTALRVVAEASDVTSALRHVQRWQPHLLLLDADLGAPTGLRETLGRIHLAAPETAVLVIDDSPDLAVLMAILEAGALGYATRADPLEDFMRATTAVLGGEASVPPRLLGGLLRNLIDRRRALSEAQRRFARLSPREQEVLRLLADGLDQGEIARELVISPQTARTHIQRVLSKLEVHSRMDAARLAHENGLVAEPGGS